ncbi:MAG: PepSY-associated TM helix domain-containing protein [Pseudomonadota bacterium]
MASASKPVLKWLRRLHLWFGVAVALPLGAIIVSGVALVLDQQMIQLRAPELFADQSTLTLGEKGRDLAKIDELAGDLSWNLVRLPQADRPYYDVWLMSDERAYFAPGADAFSDRFFWHERPETVFFEIHAHLVAGDFGETLVGFVGLAGVGLILVGVWIWWPGRRGFSAGRLAPRKADRRSMLRAHGAWGVVLALPLGVLFLTGVATAFPDQTKSVFGSVAGGNAPARAEIGVPAFPKDRPDWTAVLTAAESAFDDDKIVFVFTPNPGQDGAIYMRTRRAAEWHPNGRSEINVDATKAILLSSRDLTAADSGLQAANAMFPIHATRGGAWWLAPVAFVTGLLACWLLVFSIAAFVRRWRR